MTVGRGKSTTLSSQPPLSHRIARGADGSVSVTVDVAPRTGSIARTAPASVDTSIPTSASKKPVRLSRGWTCRAVTVSERAELS
jgi:hypothetical protein